MAATLPLTKLAETATTITLGWTPVGDRGYRFTREKANGKWSYTWDATRKQVTFSKDSAWYTVEALGLEASGTYRPSLPAPFTVSDTISDGQVIDAPVEWSATASVAVARVDFYIDGVLKWSEHLAPYVFNGDGGKFDPNTLPSGTHQFRVVATTSVGTTAESSSSAQTKQTTTPPPPPPPTTGTEGRLPYLMYATSQADAYVPIENKPWVDAHWDYAICWDPPMTWLMQGFPYRDGEAIYPGGSTAWVIKDTSGKFVWLSGYVGREYLADVGNPDFRNNFITWAKAQVAKGHVGIYIDDVNMTTNFATDSGAQAQAVNPRTGAVYTRDTWCADYTQFLDMIRAAIPTAKIYHNPVWFHSPNHDAQDVWVQKQIKACDFCLAERGFNDTGFTGGTGPWSVHRFLVYCDNVHALGKGIGFLGYGNSAADAERNLAGSLIANAGKDMFYSDYGWGKTNWWPLNDADLGAGEPRTYNSNTGLFRREFEKGVALLLEPGRADVTSDGVVLKARQGRVLVH